MLDFQISLDPLSLAALGRFEHMDLLPGAVQASMGYAGTLLVSRMQQLMSERFKNPTGQVAGSLQVIRDSQYQIEVGSNEPYARRAIETGFSGRTDALGRFYPEWPIGAYAAGYHIASDALAMSEDEIGERLAATIEAGWARLGGGA